MAGAGKWLPIFAPGSCSIPRVLSRAVLCTVTPPGLLETAPEVTAAAQPRSKSWSKRLQRVADATVFIEFGVATGLLDLHATGWHTVAAAAGERRLLVLAQVCCHEYEEAERGALQQRVAESQRVGGAAAQLQLIGPQPPARLLAAACPLLQKGGPSNRSSFTRRQRAGLAVARHGRHRRVQGAKQQKLPTVAASRQRFLFDCIFGP